MLSKNMFSRASKVFKVVVPRNSPSQRTFSTGAKEFNRSSSLGVTSAYLTGVLLGAGAITMWNFKNQATSFADAGKLVDAGVPADLAAIASAAQPTVVSGGHPVGAFVTIHLKNGTNLRAVARSAARVEQLVEEFAPRDHTQLVPSVTVGVGFAAEIWEPLSKALNKPLPKALTKHTDRSGSHGDIPATGGELFLHIKAETYSLAFETVKAFVEALPPDSIEKIEDWYGFQFQEGRDLSGFLDGTENPSELRDRIAAGVISKADDPNHENGSYVIHQRWVHLLKPFHALSQDHQELVVGRSKPDSAELDLTVSPITSHVRRMRVNGDKVPIVRQSMPYGTFGGEHGLLFIAYANTPAKFDILLDRMVGKDSPNKHNDAIMSFSKCVSSQYYYVPSVAELKSL